MGYDQYTVPDTVAVESSIVAFLQHLQTYVHGLSCHSFKFQNHPQYVSGLSCALFPITFLEMVVYVVQQCASVFIINTNDIPGVPFRKT